MKIILHTTNKQIDRRRYH